MNTASNNNIARAILLGTEGKQGHELSLYFKNVVQFLVRRHLFSRNKEILESLRKIMNQEEGIVNAQISSVEKLNHKTKEDLTHFLKKRYNAKEITLEEKLDGRLLGGVKIEIENESLDLSLRNKIKKLQEYLTRNYE